MAENTTKEALIVLEVSGLSGSDDCACAVLPVDADFLRRVAADAACLQAANQQDGSRFGLVSHDGRLAYYGWDAADELWELAGGGTLNGEPEPPYLLSEEQREALLRRLQECVECAFRSLYIHSGARAELEWEASLRHVDEPMRTVPLAWDTLLKLARQGGIALPTPWEAEVRQAEQG